MKLAVVMAFVFSTFIGQSQTFDFGVELRTNSNLMSNRIIQEEGTSAVPSHTSADDLNSFTLPTYNFAYVGDNLQNLFVRFDKVDINNNVEVPIFVRFTSKNDMYIDFKVSGGRYQVNYSGSIYRDIQFYKTKFGTYDDFKINYGDSRSVSEYISWFDDKVEGEPTSKATANMVEDVKLRTFQLWIGKQFLEHKRIQPFLTAGVHYRRTVSSYQRRHFAVDEDFLGQSLIKRDMSEITEDIPSWSQSMLGFGVRTGFHIYRYHFGVSSEYSFNLGNGNEGPSVYGFEWIGAGFRTFSMDIGIDLFTQNKRTKKMRDIIYNEEFNNLSSTLDKNRAWTLNVNIKAPVHSAMESANQFSLIKIEEVFDPFINDVNLDWQSISFKSIDLVHWIPKIELGFRYNIIERLDFEIAAGFSRVNIDSRVQEVNARLLLNNFSGEYEYDEPNSTANYAVYRTTFVPLFLGANLYLKVLSKDAFDLKIFGGAAVNAFANLSSPNVSTEFGINGIANGIYQTAEDVVFQRGFETELIENIDNSYHSDFARDVDFNQSAQTLVNNHSGKESLADAITETSIIYPTINLGAEVEFNRFLCGVSGEFTPAKVDDLLVGSYSNISLNLGYILKAKNRLNKKLRD